MNRDCDLGVCFSVKYFPDVKYFRERKIFSSIWLHFKNYIRKQFSVFGDIMKMLFSYKIFHIFSTSKQILYHKIHHHPHISTPQKIHHHLHTSTHRKSTTIHTKPTTTQHRNHQNTITHTTTTTTTTKSEIKERKQINDEIDLEEEIDQQVADDEIDPKEEMI